MDARRALFAALAVVASAVSGCRAVGNHGVTRPGPIAAGRSVTAEQVAAKINRNARAIETAQAQAQITLNGRPGSAGGLMAWEAPRNFRLQLRTNLKPDIADLGSNDSGFWFSDSQDRKLYVGNYDASGRVPANVPLAAQPDWIIESLGLRELGPEEVASMKVERGKKAGTLVASHRRTGSNGEPCIKTMVLDERTLQVLSHELYSSNSSKKTTLLARAEIQGYHTLSGPSSDAAVSFPKTVSLKWYVPEPFGLTAQIDAPDLNVEMAGRRDGLFARPSKKPGYETVSLDQASPNYASAPTTIRETRPAPSSGPAIELGDPSPLDEGAMRTVAPAPLGPDLPPGQIEPEAIIGARLPRPPGDEGPRRFARGNKAYRPLGVER